MQRRSMYDMVPCSHCPLIVDARMYPLHLEISHTRPVPRLYQFPVVRSPPLPSRELMASAARNVRRGNRNGLHTDNDDDSTLHEISSLALSVENTILLTARDTHSPRGVNVDTVSRTLSQEEHNRFRGSDEVCPICLVDMFEPSATREIHVRRLTCGHLFCHACISKWIPMNPKCPLCNTNLTIYIDRMTSSMHRANSP